MRDAWHTHAGHDVLYVLGNLEIDTNFVGGLLFFFLNFVVVALIVGLCQNEHFILFLLSILVYSIFTTTFFFEITRYNADTQHARTLTLMNTRTQTLSL